MNKSIVFGFLFTVLLFLAGINTEIAVAQTSNPTMQDEAVTPVTLNPEL